MSLTRNSLKGMGLPDEQVSAIIEMHAETTEALKAQRDQYKADAEKLAIVQAELDSIKNSGNDWQKMYEDKNSEFESFKNDIHAKEEITEKRNAYRELLKDAGIFENMIDTVLKGSDLSAIKMEDGKIVDAEKLTESIKEEWKPLIVSTQTSGASTQIPPENSGSKLTKEEILKIKNSAERQKAIAENIDLFR